MPQSTARSVVHQAINLHNAGSRPALVCGLGADPNPDRFVGELREAAAERGFGVRVEGTAVYLAEVAP